MGSMAVAMNPIASSSGAASWPDEIVTLGSACSHSPAVSEGSLPIVQPDTSPSMLSLNTTLVPMLAMALKVDAGAVGGSVKISPLAIAALT